MSGSPHEAVRRQDPILFDVMLEPPDFLPLCCPGTLFVDGEFIADNSRREMRWIAQKLSNGEYINGWTCLSCNRWVPMGQLRSRLDTVPQLDLFDYCLRHQRNCGLAVDMKTDDVFTCCVQLDDYHVTVDSRCLCMNKATIPVLSIADTLIDPNTSSDENRPIVDTLIDSSSSSDEDRPIAGDDAREVGDAELDGVDYMEVERDAIELFTNLCRDQGIDI